MPSNFHLRIQNEQNINSKGIEIGYGRDCWLQKYFLKSEAIPPNMSCLYVFEKLNAIWNFVQNLYPASSSQSTDASFEFSQDFSS